MNKKKLTITMIANIIAFVVNSGIGFILTPYIVSHVGAEANGFVSLANSFTSYIQILTIALNSMAGRFITISLVQKKYDEANKYFTSTFYANSLMAVVLFVVGTVFVLNLESIINISETLIIDVKILFAFVFLAYLLTLIGSTFTIATFAVNRKDLEAKRNIESHIIKGALIAILFTILSPHVFYVGIASLVMVIYTLTVNLIYTKKLTPQIVINKRFFDKGKIFELVKSGIWSSLSRLGSVLSNGLDLLVANLFIGPQAMGLLSVAKILPNVISPFIGTIGGVFAPSYTIAYAKQDKKLLLHEMNKSMKILSLISNLCLAVLAVIGTHFFSLWVPELNAVKLQILSLITIMGLTVNGAIQCVWNVFTITNKIKMNSIVSTSISFLNILIVFLLLKVTNLGVFAVAGVSSVTTILKSVFFSIPYAAKCIDIKKRFFFIPVLKCFFSLLLSVTISTLICQLINNNTWITLFLKAFITAIVVIIITLLFVTEKKDRNIFYSFMKHVLKKQN